MHRLSAYTVLVARVLISVVFVLNALGIIDQTIPARELAERGMPLSLVPAIMMSGRIVEFIAGIALALGIFPRLAAVALFGFLVPATFVSHSFWLAAGTPAFQGQLINFSKNAAIWGGLLFIAAIPARNFLLHRDAGGNSELEESVPKRECGLRLESQLINREKASTYGKEKRRFESDVRLRP